MSKLIVALVAASMFSACAEDKVIGPEGDIDGGKVIDSGLIADGGPPVDAPPGTPPCSMTGVWIAAQVTFSTALGAQQKAVNWYYHDITQTGDNFTITKSLDCGFRVTGTTTVTLKEPTMEALAKRSSSVGRKGTFKPSASGNTCDFTLGRAYSLRGANMATFLTSQWMVGDPDKALNTFPALPGNAAAGMEDWDNDGKEGFTLVTGLGERYVAQRDWASYAGPVPQQSLMFGGADLVVTWDGQETVSQQTAALLRTGSTPTNPGRVYFARVDNELTVVTGANAELETCKNVQRLALAKFPNP